MEKQFNIDEVYSPQEMHMHDTIISKAADIAEKLTELECKVNGIECYVSEMEGETEVLSYTEEAQEIFNVYYDQYTEELYHLLNSQLKLL